MMALMENAAMLAVADELPEGCTTVGGHIESSHLKPSKIGDKVSAIAEVTKVEGELGNHPYCVFIPRDVCRCSEGNGKAHRLYRFENRERNGLD